MLQLGMHQQQQLADARRHVSSSSCRSRVDSGRWKLAKHVYCFAVCVTAGYWASNSSRISHIIAVLVVALCRYMACIYA
jgi:hypothetical protein